MKTKISVIFIGLVMLFAGCESESESQSLTFTMGNVCGWCAGSDSIVITSDKTIYTSYNPCDQKGEKSIYKTSAEDWDKLTSLFNHAKFEKIYVNSCNVCVDGCDNWIRVENGDFKHEIRFGYSDSTILKPIKEFVEKLNYEKSKYSSSD